MIGDELVPRHTMFINDREQGVLNGPGFFPFLPRLLPKLDHHAFAEHSFHAVRADIAAPRVRASSWR